MIYELQSLQSACRNGQTFRFLHFWGHQPRPDGKPSPSCFSQWWVAPFVHEGISYRTAEHWMMASKARLFKDEAALARILATESPQTAKKIGREVRGFDPEVWDKHKFDLVYAGNKLKFAQHPDLMAFLQSTGDAIIVEASPYDKIWGIGMKADHPSADDPLRWNGENLLGFALMRVRDENRP